MLKRALFALLFLGLPAGAYAQDVAPGTQTPNKKVEKDGPRKERKVETIPVEAIPLATPVEPTSDPMEILRRAAEAAKGLGRVYYEASLKGRGPLAAHVPSLWGTVVLGGRSATSIEKFRVMVPTVVPGTAGLVTAMAGSDGKNFFLVDVKNKTVTESKDRAVISDMEQVLRYLAVPELVHTNPFDKVMKADKVEFKGTTKVSGIPCYIVQVSNADGTEQADWFFSTIDELPRRVDRIKVDSTGKTGTISVTLDQLAANPGMQRDPFTKYVPEGYQVR